MPRKKLNQMKTCFKYISDALRCLKKNKKWVP